jgi:DNA-directed RNA polymerase subunit L
MELERFPEIAPKAKSHRNFYKQTSEIMVMEFEVLEESKTKMEFTLRGETHTFCNILKDELRQVKGVTIATYRIDHPLVGIPRFLIETKGVEPRKAVKSALANLKKKAQAFEKEIKNV